MTAKEVHEKTGLSMARVYQFCRDRGLDTMNISDEDFTIIKARMHTKRAKNANDQRQD